MWMILSILTALIDIVIVHLMYNKFLVQKSSKMIMFFSGLGFVILMQFLGYFSEVIYEFTNGFVFLPAILHTVHLFSFVLFILVYAFINFKNVKTEWRLQFTLAILLTLLIQLCDFFSFGFTMFIFGINNSIAIMDMNQYQLVGTICFYISLAFSFIMFMRIPKPIYPIPQKHFRIIITVLLFTAIWAMVVFEYLALIESSSPFFYIAIPSLFVIILVTVIGFFINTQNLTYERMMKAILGKQLDHFTHQYNIYEKTFDELRRNRHDTQKHFQLIKHLIDTGNIDELTLYMKQLLDYTAKIISPQFFSGNTIVDSILDIYKQICINLEITLKCTAALQAEMAIDLPDLCVIISNALENAIEATIGIENAENRKIDLTIQMRQVFLFIIICNPISTRPILEGDYFITTKNDKNVHGQGLRIIESIAKKYNGRVQMKIEGNIFTFNCALQIMENGNENSY